MKFVVTGCSGFLGINLCRQLADEGHTVHGLDIEPPQFELPDIVDFQQHDLTTQLRISDADVVVHFAAHSQVQPVVSNPTLAIENIDMTQTILEAARRSNANVINASSRDVYGNAMRPSETEVTPDSPNGYAASKIGAEAMATAYTNTFNVDTVSLRLSNVYGPKDMNQRVIPIFIALADAGKPLEVYGEGKLLDFVHVEDVCDAIITTAQRLPSISGEAINIGSGVGVPLTTVAEKIADLVDSCPGWSITKNRSGDVTQYVSDVTTAEELLDYSPETSFDERLKDVVDWYTDHPNLLNQIREEIE